MARLLDRPSLSPETWQELEELLLLADVGMPTVAPAMIAPLRQGSSPSESQLAEGMDARLEAIERSVNRLIPLVRKVLYSVTTGKETE